MYFIVKVMCFVTFFSCLFFWLARGPIRRVYELSGVSEMELYGEVFQCCCVK